MNSLADKTALVTGASRGIGRAIALALAEEGTRVLVHYGRSQQQAEAVVSTIRQSGGKADALMPISLIWTAPRCWRSR
jgi:NAD(P)-dependent dehydrogenase (short-subunit alcohol dehydrogenase family)